MEGTSSPLTGAVHGPYRIEGLIATGGMGQVYRALDTRLQRPVAIKAIHTHFIADAQARERFLRETRLACRVNHPYVATVYDVLEAGDQPLLVMEFIDGRTLSRVLQEEKRDPSQLWLWIIEIVDALAAIHRAGLVHRDLKPGNVMITRDGHVKVMDFGLSRVDSSTSPDSGAATLTQYDPLTREGAVLGTLQYASPEQLRGETVDRRSDLFSLGILMYETLTGTHPFRRRTGPETLSAILHDAPAGGPLPPLLREGGHVQVLLEKLLAKSPGQRHADADSVLVELRTMPGTSGLAQAMQVSPRRSWRLALVLVAIVGLLLAAGSWWLRQPPVWNRSG